MNRLVAALLLGLALTLVPQASPRMVWMAPPTGLHAFLLRVDEPVTRSFPRTPSFAWNAVREQSGHYQFQLATSNSFEDSSMVYKAAGLQVPAVVVPRQLPWMTGDPYALWARVRWISDTGETATPWSVAFGFNIQWRPSDVPSALPAPLGLVRWKPIEGATAYEVLYPDLIPAESFLTTTNVADEREFFTFHNALGVGAIHWRVRAIRSVDPTQGAANGLPAVSYGPWSPVFTTVNKPLQDAAVLRPTDTVSDTWDKGTQAHAHELTPGFAWTPTAPVISQGIDPGSSLYRVYISTDRNCVNRVFTGSIVGSPAYAPRITGGPMPLPGSTQDLATAENAPPYLTGSGSEGTALDATGQPVVSNETAGLQVGSGGTTATGKSASGSGAQASVAGVDLWDSGWPSGRYYWTVVPVSVEVPLVKSTPAVTAAPATTTTTSGSTSGGSTTTTTATTTTTTASTTAAASGSGSPATSTPITYHDMAVPQDSCQAGLGMSFGKISQPVVTSAGGAYVSGVAPASGRVVAAASPRVAVDDLPLVAWQPAVGATSYQVELSKRLYPWHAVKSLTTQSTAVILPLQKTNIGTWYYHVRGIDDSLPTGATRMSWSKVVAIRITGDRFVVLR